MKDARSTNARGGVANVPKPKPAPKPNPGPDPEQREFKPEAKAASWAVRNAWFGTDVEMTEAAYGVHDDLVAEGVDPTSDLYYQQIEERIKLQYPDKFRTGGNNTEKRYAEREKLREKRSQDANKSKERQLDSELRKMNRPKPTASATSSVRQILNGVKQSSYQPRGCSNDWESNEGQFNGDYVVGGSIYSDNRVTYNGSASTGDCSAPRRSPNKQRSHRGKPGWAGETSSSKQSDINSFSPFIVNTQDFLVRRQAVLEELKQAKIDAQFEHQRLQEKIRRRMQR
mmetsp:Transcript_20455/g.28336  ORF Transcript_20455/g.28336 Transcript_20455/m.28336 type:complete len:285 (+) Transcript_20455:89-943(+)